MKGELSPQLSKSYAHCIVYVVPTHTLNVKYVYIFLITVYQVIFVVKKISYACHMYENILIEIFFNNGHYYYMDVTYMKIF